MTTTIQISCPYCGHSYAAVEGGAARCPKCGKAPTDAPSRGDVPLPPPPPPPPGSALPPPPPLSYARPGTTAGQSIPVQVLEYGRSLTLTWWERARAALAKHARDITLSSAEQDALAARGVHDPAVQRHFAWRRSLLWLIVLPTTFTAIMGTINTFTDLDGLSKFGVFMLVLYVVSLWAIPAAAVLAARIWDRPRSSRMFLLGGFLVSFLMIVLFGLVPFRFWIKMDEELDPQSMALAQQAIAMAGGAIMALLLLPAILSLLPGAIRACVRIKVLFPESIVSGWLLITIAPLYVLFLLTLFILVNQAAGSFLLIVGAAGFVAAPVTYLVRTPLFIRPLWTEEERARVARAQWVYIITLAAAGGLLILYALTARVMDTPLVGSKANGAMLGFWSFSWHAFKFMADYIGRSLFITALAMDYFLLINVSVWQNTRAFEKTDHAAEYERTITELGTVLEKE